MQMMLEAVGLAWVARWQHMLMLLEGCLGLYGGLGRREKADADDSGGGFAWVARRHLMLMMLEGCRGLYGGLGRQEGADADDAGGCGACMGCQVAAHADVAGRLSGLVWWARPLRVARWQHMLMLLEGCRGLYGGPGRQEGSDADDAGGCGACMGCQAADAADPGRRSRPVSWARPPGGS